jgi:hypothetical protein
MNPDSIPKKYQPPENPRAGRAPFHRAEKTGAPFVAGPPQCAYRFPTLRKTVQQTREI